MPRFAAVGGLAELSSSMTQLFANAVQRRAGLHQLAAQCPALMRLPGAACNLPATSLRQDPLTHAQCCTGLRQLAVRCSGLARLPGAAGELHRAGQAAAAGRLPARAGHLHRAAEQVSPLYPCRIWLVEAWSEQR